MKLNRFFCERNKALDWQIARSSRRLPVMCPPQQEMFYRRGGDYAPSAFEGVTADQSPHLPTTRMTNEPGFTLGQRSPGAGGPRSAAERKTLCVFKSSAIVRALFFVGTLSATVNLSGESS